jgi:hypothetical protein
LPTSLGAALDALAADAELVRAFTPQVVDWFVRVKRFELERHAAADDSDAWQAREVLQPLLKRARRRDDDHRPPRRVERHALTRSCRSSRRA